MFIELVLKLHLCQYDKKLQFEELLWLFFFFFQKHLENLFKDTFLMNASGFLGSKIVKWRVKNSTSITVHALLSQKVIRNKLEMIVNKIW